MSLRRQREGKTRTVSLYEMTLGRSTVLQLTMMYMSALACSSTDGLSAPPNRPPSMPFLAAAFEPAPPPLSVVL